MTALHLAAGQSHPVSLTLNGRPRSAHAEPRMLLCDFLRHELQAYGVHVGCEHGVCGACTVLVDGKAVRSCTQYAVQADGTDIVSAEGLAEPGTLKPRPDLVKGLLRASLERRLLLLSCGTRAQVVRVIPPLVTTDDEVDLAVRIIGEALTEVGA